MNLIPLADSSMAVHVRDDLTPDEVDLCGLTARIEDTVCMIMDKLLALIEQSTTATTGGAQPAHGALTKPNAKLSLEVGYKSTNLVNLFRSKWL